MSDDSLTLSQLGGNLQSAVLAGDDDKILKIAQELKERDDGESSSLECGRCGVEIEEKYGDYYVIEEQDVGKDAEGETARIIREDTEKFGRAWKGFKEEDKGVICNDCSYVLANKRSEPERANSDDTASSEPEPDAWILDGTALSAETYDGEDIEGAEALYTASTITEKIDEKIKDLESARGSCECSGQEQTECRNCYEIRIAESHLLDLKEVFSPE